MPDSSGGEDAAFSLCEKQPHIVISLPGEVHAISIVQIRQLANGCEYNGDKDLMIKILAQAVKDLME